MDGTRISVNPPDDVVFATRVRQHSATVDDPNALEALLRADYPQVRVVRGVTDIVDRWYVYRDGRWTRS